MATLELARAAHGDGNLQQAIGICSEIVRNDPANFEAICLLADFASEAGRVDQAARLIELGLSLSPCDAGQWLKLGRIRLARGSSSGAAYAFRRVLAIEPDNRAAAEGYGLAMDATPAGQHDYHPPFTSQIPGLASLYKSIFGYKTDGTFLEIGAFDGETHSNTSFLADIGWTGFYVEPVLESARACAARHRSNRVSVIHAAIGAADGSAEISVAGPLSSMASHHIDKFNEVSWGQGAHDGQYRAVEVLSPETLLARTGIGHCDVFVLDVEGFEWPIIQAFDLTRFRPTAAIVETRDRSPEFGAAIQAESENVKAKFIDAGYRIGWRDDLNIVFVAA